MTIIIETPQPPVRERLMRVPDGAVVPTIRETSGGSRTVLRVTPGTEVHDAEPADLERAGYTLRDHEARQQRDNYRANYGDAIAERDEARREAAKLDANLGKTLAAATAAGWDGIENPKAVWDFVAHLARERDEARTERDKPDAKLAQAEERGDLADQRAIDAIAERDEARRGRNDALQVLGQAREALPSDMRGGWLVDVLQRVERERDEARAALATMTRQRDDALQVLGQAREALPSDMRGGWLVDAVRRLVRERDEARAALAAMTRQHDDATALASRLRCDLDRATDREDGVAAERARIVAIVREDARRLRLSWPTIADAMLALADRLERGEHADTPVPAAEPRATDEELVGLFDAAASRRAAVAAVAARVRREQPAHAELDAAWAAAQVPVRGLTTLADVITTLRERPAVCLVTRAVEANVDIRVCEDDGGGFMVGVHAPGDDEDLERNVPAADVPATLARLLGEVTRGQ